MTYYAWLGVIYLHNKLWGSHIRNKDQIYYVSYMLTWYNKLCDDMFIIKFKFIMSFLFLNDIISCEVVKYRSNLLCQISLEPS